MKTAFVTLMTGGDNYLPGVEALGKSIDDTGTTTPKVVMVTGDVSPDARRVMRQGGWVVRDIAPIPPPAGNEVLFERFKNSYTKLRVFQLTEYDKVVFLDADTIVMSPIDELFERPFFAAAPDFFMPNRFNSGVMVLDPDEQRFSEIIAMLGKAETYDGGDQGILNSYFDAHFGGWWAMPVEHRLPASYNLHHFIYQFMQAHPVLQKSFNQELKVMHYTLQKPWQSFNMSGGSDVWWEKFYEAHPEKLSRLRQMVHTWQDRSFGKFVGMISGG
jgi:alpha-N-acetylglucosamine transferase